MKYQEILKSTQPVFYRILTRSFISGNVPHAYLLVGNNTVDAATFIAQSLVCRKEVLACEECNDCRRIKERLYPDMIVFDGNETSIKKEDIEHIQTEFYKSSFENKAKIYILKSIENASNVAMNALLKFLEEPVEGVYAILTTRNINKVLPTIQSRCQIIHLLPESKESIRLSLIKDGVTNEDAKIMSQLYTSYQAASEAKDTEEYAYVKLQVLNFIEDLYEHPSNIMITQQIHIAKDYKNDKNVIRLYLNMLVLALRDVFHVKHSIPLTFEEHKKIFDKCPDDVYITNRIDEVLNTLYLIDTNANIGLLLDGMAYKITRGELMNG